MEQFVTRQDDGVHVEHHNLKDYLLANDVAQSIFDIDIEDSSIVVDWSLGMELRTWGIKGIYFGTDRIVCELDVSIFFNEESDNVDKTHKIEIDTDKDDTWKIVDEREVDISNSCVMPNRVLIDFDEKTIDVSYE